MSRAAYRHKVEILRRPQESTSKGGYAPDEYEKVGETSCSVRDESGTEFATAESARVEHVLSFRMRKRKILKDDMLVFGGPSYQVIRVDNYLFNGREITVKAKVCTSKYSLKAKKEQMDGVS